MTYPDADTIVEIDAGQIAISESFIEILPHGLATDLRADDQNPIADIVLTVETQLNAATETDHDRILTECRGGQRRLASHLDGVAYALKCGYPGNEADLKRRVNRVLDTTVVPSWVWAAFHAMKRLYIGGTHRPDVRIQEHMHPDGEWEFAAADFTAIFPPNSIESLVLCYDADPYAVEAEIAAFWCEDATTFVYQA